MLPVKFVDQTARSSLLITTFRMFINAHHSLTFSTSARKNVHDLETLIPQADSRSQVMALQDNVKEFGLTYFGMGDRRQGT